MDRAELFALTTRIVAHEGGHRGFARASRSSFRPSPRSTAHALLVDLFNVTVTCPPIKSKPEFASSSAVAPMDHGRNAPASRGWRSRPPSAWSRVEPVRDAHRTGGAMSPDFCSDRPCLRGRIRQCRSSGAAHDVAAGVAIYMIAIMTRYLHTRCTCQDRKVLAPNGGATPAELTEI